jgi:ThiF family
MDDVLAQNIIAIQQLDSNLSKEQLSQFLLTRRIGLILSDDAPAHQVALRTAANLLCRNSFQVFVGGDSTRLNQIMAEAEFLGLHYRRLSQLDHYDLRIGIGSERPNADLCAFASGWNVLVASGARNHEIAQPSNEICGALLGVLIAAAAFNRTVGPILGKTQFEPELNICVLDYSSSISRVPAVLTPIYVPHATLIGCGAIGNAFVYALSVLPALVGILQIVDPDWFTKTNSHRYMLARIDYARTQRLFKTIRAKEFLAHHSQLKVQGYEKNFQQYLEEDCDDRRVPFLISAVDDHAKRRQLGRETPLEAINASTGSFTLAATTHYGAYGPQESPCVGCHYPYRTAETERHAVVARETGLSLSEVESLSTANAPMTITLLETIAAFRGLSGNYYAEFEGQPFDSFYQHGICGGTEVETNNGKLEIPLAHVSAAAGVLLAVELVKRFTPELRQHALNNFLQLDMLNITSDWFQQKKSARADCECRTHIYQRRFAAKYRK